MGSSTRNILIRKGVNVLRVCMYYAYECVGTVELRALLISKAVSVFDKRTCRTQQFEHLVNSSAL